MQIGCWQILEGQRALKEAPNSPTGGCTDRYGGDAPDADVKSLLAALSPRWLWKPLSLVRSCGRLDETVQTFLHGLEPWEVKEPFSLHQYASDVYDKIIQDITQDLHPNDP